MITYRKKQGVLQFCSRTPCFFFVVHSARLAQPAVLVFSGAGYIFPEPGRRHKLLRSLDIRKFYLSQHQPLLGPGKNIELDHKPGSADRLFIACLCDDDSIGL